MSKMNAEDEISDPQTVISSEFPQRRVGVDVPLHFLYRTNVAVFWRYPAA
jgi:hypothetical protein